MGWRERRWRGGRLGSGRGACASQEARHLLGDRMMLLAAEHRTQRTAGKRSGRDRRREKALFGALLSLQRVLDARPPVMFVLDCAHEGFERRGLRVVIATADQGAVTAG